MQEGMVMKYLVVLIALASACNLTAVPTGPFINVFGLLQGKQDPVFTLCLDNSTTENSFSLGKLSTFGIMHLTIQ